MTPEQRAEVIAEFNKAVRPAKFVIAVDFEATCSEDRIVVPRHEMEIIEIGCALVDTKSGEVVDTFSSFIKPILHPTLTPFCTELTSITQDDVDTAPLFREAADNLTEWLRLRGVTRSVPAIWISWGDFDAKMIVRDAALNNVRNPLAHFPHFNLKRVEACIRGDQVAERSLFKSVSAYNMPWYGTHHRGVDDAVNLAHIYKHLF